MAAQLTCGACGFGNEPERVYCHNCGGKLDRDLMPSVGQDTTSGKAAQRRIRKMTNPAGYTFGRFLKSLIMVLVWATIFSSVYLISQKPAWVPEESKELSMRLVTSELMEAVQSPAPQTISFTEAEINAALKQSLRGASSSGDVGAPGVEFQRAYALLKPNVIHIGAQQSLWGFPVYSGVDYRVTVAEGKLTPILLGGNFGRLPVPPKAMQYLDFTFRKFWVALKREREQVEKMQSVQISQGQITFVTRGAGAR